MLVHWIWLHHRPKVTDKLKAELLRSFRDAEDVFCAERDALVAVEGMTPEALEAIQDKSLEEAQEILRRCEELGIGILTIEERRYPDRLRNIPDPPLVLYYRGKLPELDEAAVIAVVGTRKASAYGLRTARRMGYQIAACGGIVVSGLASGIDAMAMQGALLAGKPTVGVLGCGVDVVYPQSNRSLFRDVEGCGCILSEFAPGTPGRKWNFPRRNRIISGLSCGVLVVEAPERSGSLITAALALEQGRDVFAVPGNIDQPGFMGSNRLLREGATAVSDGWDILQEYESHYPGILRKGLPAGGLPDLGEGEGKVPSEPEREPAKVAQKPKLPEKKRHDKEKLKKKAIDKEPSGSYSDVNDILPRLSEEERKIVSLLAEGEQLVDAVIYRSQIPAGRFMGLITMLELKGILHRLPGKRITLVRK